MDNCVAVLAFVYIFGLIGFFFGFNSAQDAYTPDKTYNSTCYALGGEPYAHTVDDRSISVCIKGGTTVPVVIR